MAYKKSNSNGQATMANSEPVVIASNQTAIPVTTDLGRVEDVAHASGDTGVMSLAVRNDANVALTTTDGDYSPIAVDAYGRTMAVVQSVSPGTFASALGKAEDAGHTSGDVGVMMLGVRNDGAATVLSNNNGDYTPIGVDAAGIVFVQQKATTATLSNVASSATSVTLLAANSARKGAQIYNDSSQVLYVKFGVTASLTSFTVPLAASTYYEVPAGYTGIIDGIWASANGTARVTEET